MDGMALTSASGQALSIIKNDTGVFVVSGEVRLSFDAPSFPTSSANLLSFLSKFQVTAQVLRADVPIKNGVVHSEFFFPLPRDEDSSKLTSTHRSFHLLLPVIDSVLLNTASNPEAAESAASVAVSSKSLQDPELDES